jgi:hypothetical protein
MLAENREGADRIAGLASGFARDVGNTPLEELRGIRSLNLTAKEAVAGRTIIRHDTPVTRTLLYKLRGRAGSIIIYLAADRSLADYDLVDR